MAPCGMCPKGSIRKYSRRWSLSTATKTSTSDNCGRRAGVRPGLLSRSASAYGAATERSPLWATSPDEGLLNQLFGSVGVSCETSREPQRGRQVFGHEPVEFVLVARSGHRETRPVPPVLDR